DNVRDFSGFENYRNAYRKHFENCSQAQKPTDKPTRAQGENKFVAPFFFKESNTKNKSLLRKENAKRKNRIRELEQLIEILEQEQLEAQEQFTKETKPDEYVTFAKKGEQLDAFIEEYLLLVSEDESDLDDDV